MDVGTSNLLSYFETGDLFPWHDARASEIERRRALLDDTLIFDILLSLGKIRAPDTLYPPMDAAGLERLLDAIYESTYDKLKKDCLVYFLLKWHRDGREKRFQKDRHIPPQFAQLAEAYWCLDAAVNVPMAVSLLCDSRLNQDYSSKILQAISTAEDIDPHPLIVRYIRTAKPLLTEPADLDLYLVALAHQSLFEAWKFQRSFNETDATRSRLFKKMLEWSVSPKPKPTPLAHLLTVPLTSFEQSVLHSFASFPPATTPQNIEFVNPPSPLGLATLQNLACTRLIQTGQYAEAIKLHHKFSVVGSKSSLPSAATKMVQERSNMIQTLYSTLPSVERTLLDAEMQGTPMFSVTSTSTSGDTSLSDSQSWEQIQLTNSMVHINGADRSRPAINGGGRASISTTPKEPALPTPSSTPTVNVPSSFTLTASSSPGNFEKLTSSRSGATRFGGAPPILPISGSAAPELASSSGFGGIPTLNTSTNILNFSVGGLPSARGRKSIPGAAVLGSSSASPSTFNMGSGVGGGVGSPNPLFSSSKRKPNAFYKPPVVNNDSALPNPFSEEPDLSMSRRSPTQSQSPERRPQQHQKLADEDVGKDAEAGVGAMDVDGHTGPSSSLDYSLFVENDGQLESNSRKNFGFGTGTGSAGSPTNSAGRRKVPVVEISSSSGRPGRAGPGPYATARSSLSTISTGSKRPPGAFTDDDDDDDEMDLLHEEPPATRQTRSRNSTVNSTSNRNTISAASGVSSKSSASASAVSSSSRTTTKPKAKKPRQTATKNSSSKLKRSVPGGMYDDDDDDEEEEQSKVLEEEEEDQDQVAPLATTRNTKRPTRKTRSSGAADTLLVEDLGSRRRSSRISTTRSGSEDSQAGTTSRKNTRSTGTKKKQR